MKATNHKRQIASDYVYELNGSRITDRFINGKWVTIHVVPLK